MRTRRKQVFGKDWLSKHEGENHVFRIMYQKTNYMKSSTKRNKKKRGQELDLGLYTTVRRHQVERNNVNGASNNHIT
jgi:hypothetical protein